MAWRTYLQVIIYIALLFFFIPIKISGPGQVEVQFQEYLRQFNKTYDDPVLYKNRLQAFKQSLEIINTYNLNKTSDSARYGLTKFSDMSPEDFLQEHLQVNLSQKLSKYHKKLHKRSVTSLPQNIDWRKYGVVTKVRNQGSCGACWAHSVVETLESMHALKAGKLEELSVAEIIKCGGNGNGCNGGDTCSLISWMKDTNFTSHFVHDYTGNCQTSSIEGVQIEDFICERLVGLEYIILDLLMKNGPLTVTVNALTWQNYIGGVIQYHCDGDHRKMNHAVQIVGFNLSANIPYYIVRNTWGEDFGDNGYLYLAINKNMCGLANEVAALTVL